MRLCSQGLWSVDVTFSDGESLKWQLAATGQLGLIPGIIQIIVLHPRIFGHFKINEDVLHNQGCKYLTDYIGFHDRWTFCQFMLSRFDR